MSSSPLTIDQIADDLRTMPSGQSDWADVLLRHAASRIVKRCVPAMAGDGPVDRDLLRDMLHASEAPMLEAIPDWAHHVGAVTVEGDVIHVAHTATGTLPDGSTFDGTATYELTVEHGEIVQLVLHHDPEESARIVAAVPSLSSLQPGAS